MTPRRLRGFALVDLITALLVAALVAAMVLLLGNAQRRQGRLGEDIGKLRQIGALTQQYAADNADLFWTFSWKKGQSLSQYPDLNNAPTDLQAATNQAVDILRRAGRTDIAPITGWAPYLLYSHLPLLDYSDGVADELFVSAADSNRLRWTRDPFGFDAGNYQPAPTSAPPGTNSGKRWPYGSSFLLPTCFYDRSTSPNRVTQGSVHNQTILSGSVVFGARLVAEVEFPSQKALQFDQNARHFGTKQPYCTHDQARLPILFVDGAVALKSAADSNGGWSPNTPTSPVATSIVYQPEAWEPATYSGAPVDFVTGRFRWTRGSATEHGHVGRDFGGPETCSGQAGCP